jgi:hypothetical protein
MAYPVPGSCSEFCCPFAAAISKNMVKSHKLRKKPNSIFFFISSCYRIMVLFIGGLVRPDTLRVKGSNPFVPTRKIRGLWHSSQPFFCPDEHYFLLAFLHVIGYKN